MSRYILVFMIDTLDDGEFSKWPLHITLIPWFEYQDDEIKLVDVLNSQIPRKVRMVKGKVGKKTWFGYSTPVRLVEPKDDLQKLHNKLLDLLKVAGVEFSSKSFTGPRFTPHVTTRGSRTIDGGQTFELNSTTLVRAVSDHPMLRQKVAELQFLEGVD